jgi:predicted amidohydrolase
MSVVAAVQMASGPNVKANLLETQRQIAEAAEQGAKLVVLPENFALMGMSETEKVGIREADGTGPIQDFLARQARRHRLWLVGGTVPLQANSPNKVRAAALLYDDQGKLAGRYDKMHLFDVELLDSGERYTESETIEAGEQLTVVDTPIGRLGLAVCYDLRFPEMFRRLADQSAQILAVPAAFTAMTGRAHWETLLRARAIENLCYVIAAAQGGFHANGRETYGHSMIVDPWGSILAQLESESGVVSAEIDLDQQARIRRHFPALDHRRV